MRPKNACMLLLTAFIWGTAFVAQSVGMDYLEPFAFNGVRCLIGAIALLPCIWFFNRGKEKENKINDENAKRDLIKGGIACGILLFAASSLQQIGLVYTAAGKAGFITAFYIVLVPVFGIFLHKNIGWKVWTAVAIALAGLYFLCITEAFTIGVGDIYVLLCALIFSVHILVVDHYAPKVDGVKLSCIQFLVAGIVSIPFMLILESPKMGNMMTSWFPLIYAGVFSCGIAYTLQILGQKNVNPAIASLILSLESCFSVLSGWVILGERLSVRETIGCIMMFAAIILAQIPDKKSSADTN